MTSYSPLPLPQHGESHGSPPAKNQRIYAPTAAALLQPSSSSNGLKVSHICVYGIRALQTPSSEFQTGCACLWRHFTAPAATGTNKLHTRFL